ncbi:UDP-glucose--hexose-1-phosphate uridylyltransferase [Paenibacillus thalictri]|uniref:Galactose-1-phosphate uridylyltransferase n=1 Tax=Paenibacillus thalictri TaxID=2527873 RepID=A0A4V2J3I5_9BACL|nr:UDP-glucose--hexose-1-phosphate uridylyltransferase [Paenibacillus thalictri]TBL72671.1 UDP-glucose--hexose-1-phosphate uridylyltransferase [Paenibacillus thalictri]
MTSNQHEQRAAQNIERLLQFAASRGLMEPIDAYAARNSLLDLLHISEPYEGTLNDPSANSPVGILEELLDYAAASGLLEDNNTTLRDLLDARMMGALMPRQSEVAAKFWQTVRHSGVEMATDDFYRLCIDANYIRMDRIASNLYWLAPTEYGDLEITVNLSKPEKDPKEIAMLKNAPQSNYPKCLLCIDNVGYAGRLNHPARQNLRVIPLELDEEPWYFQYSPYVYYNEHSIIFDRRHRPMKMSKTTFYRLLDFIDQFPHYFIGSNADLPIVGGSILNHEHFQGGKHRFAMEKAPVEMSFTHPDYQGVKAGIVNWPMSVIRISSHNKLPLLKLAGELLDAWREYSDPEQDILAYTVKDGEAAIPHNTITPIARNNGSGEYELDLVLRNNRTSEQHPDGIFHPHQELHHVKKENIGLIEVMGLAVLPGRLKGELDGIKRILSGDAELLQTAEQNGEHELNKHVIWIRELCQRYGTGLEEQAAEQAVQDEVGRKFAQVLQDAGVFKRTEHGRIGFVKWMESAGFQLL